MRLTLHRGDPAVGAECPRNRGGTTAFGADVGRIDWYPTLHAIESNHASVKLKLNYRYYREAVIPEPYITAHL